MRTYLKFIQGDLIKIKKWVDPDTYKYDVYQFIEECVCITCQDYYTAGKYEQIVAFLVPQNIDIETIAKYSNVCESCSVKNIKDTKNFICKFCGGDVSVDTRVCSSCGSQH